jgi:hypothetical protein
MRSVYKGAEQVLVWLGEDTGDAILAFEAVQKLHSYVLEGGLLGVTQLDNIIDDLQADALEALLERPWFMRVWIVQEIISARRATIVCGNRSMDWLTFLKSMDVLINSNDSFRHRCSQLYDVFLQLGNIYTHSNNIGKYTLEMLVEIYRTCKASDPRDKIFALVGLAADEGNTACIPDYSKDVLEVYRDLASYYIVEKRCVNVLTGCKLSDRVEHLLLPSWVPDWSCHTDINASPYTSPSAYRASADCPFSGTVGKDPNVLLLDGILLNKIELLGRPWTLVVRGLFASRGNSRTIHELIKEYHFRTSCELIEEILDIFSQSPRYGSDYWNAYIRALVADKDHRGRRMEGRELSHLNYRRRFSANSWAFQEEAASGKSVETPGDPSQEVINLNMAINQAGSGRTFCLFDDGRAGWVPDTAKIGDRVAIFTGAEVPILLRPQGDACLVVGETYVHEMMDGQAFADTDVKIETIKLV